MPKRKERLTGEAERLRDNAVSRAWHKANPERSAVIAKAKKAKRRAVGQLSATDLHAIYERQGGKCFWCAVDLHGHYHADHYIPVARGGLTEPANMVASCGPCNMSRGSKLPSEWKGKRA